MKKTMSRLFMAVLMVALLVSASIMSVSAANEGPTCGGNHDDWTEITAGTTITTSGNYYLGKDAPGEIKVNSVEGNTVEVTICMCGHNSVRNGATLTIGTHNTAGSGAVVNLVNCQPGADKGKLTNTGSSRAVNMYEGSTLNIGENVQFVNGANGAIFAHKDCAVNMYGGTIANNTYASGAVWVNTATAKFTMYGGEFSNNTYDVVANASATLDFQIDRSVYGVCEVEDNKYKIGPYGTCEDGHTYWTPVTGGTTLTTGFYYLNAETVTGQIKVDSGDVTLCMCGHNLTNSAQTIVVNGGSLTLVNCQAAGGNISHTGAYRAIYIAGGSVTMKDNVHVTDTITGQTGVFINGGTFNMEGGSITGNCDNVDGDFGGGVHLGKGKFTMSGGEISNNTAKLGAGVFVNNGTFEMSGGVIKDNTLIDSGNGSGVYVAAGGRILMTDGTITGENIVIFALSKTSNYSELSGGTVTGGTVMLSGNADRLLKLSGANVTAAVTALGKVEISDGVIVGTLTSRGNAATGQNFVISGGKIQGALKIYNGALSTFEISGGRFVNDPSNWVIDDYVTVADASVEPYQYRVEKFVIGECPEHSGWTALSRAQNITEPGCYYLTESFSDCTKIDVGAGEKVTLCMNGCTITNNGIVLNVASGDVTLTNCAKEHGVITGTTGAQSAVQINGSGATLTMCDGVEVAGGDPREGVGIFGGATFIMEGGAVKNCTTTYGGVRVHSGSFIMNGGEISGNTATDNGGGVHMDSGAVAFTMNGGKICGNTAIGKNGDGVYVNGGPFTMSGGEISGNGDWTAPEDGSEPEKTLDGAGGGVYVNGKPFTMTGGTIKENWASNGAGVMISGSSTVTLSDDAKIIGNEAISGGGVAHYGGTLTMTGGEISGNTAANGGGVYMNGGTFNMNGGAISGNKATTTTEWSAGGAGVYVAAAATVNMSDGTIRENTAAKHGGGVCLLGKFNLSGDAKVIDNVATATNASGFLVRAGSAKLTMTDGTIKGGGNLIYVINSTATAEISGGTVIGTIYSNNDTNIVNLSGDVCVDGGIAGTGVTTVTGGQFSSDTTREKLEGYLPADSGLVVADVEDGAYIYKVCADGFCSSGEFMDFKSALALGVYVDNPIPEGYTASYTMDGKTVNVVGTIDGMNGILAEGVAAKDMDKKITYTIKNASGETVFCKTVSVYDAAQNWLADDVTKDDTLVKDMINYGIEAQKVFLGEAKMETLGSTDTTPRWTAIESGHGVKEDYKNDVAVTLSLKDQIELNIYVRDEVTVSENSTKGYTVEDLDGGITRISYRDINVVDAAEAVTMIASNGAEVTFSITDYCIAAKNGAQSDLINALMKYIESVYQYMGK